MVADLYLTFVGEVGAWVCEIDKVAMLPVLDCGLLRVLGRRTKY